VHLVVFYYKKWIYVTTGGEGLFAHRFVGNISNKLQLGKSRNRWYDNIKMELREIR